MTGKINAGHIIKAALGLSLLMQGDRDSVTHEISSKRVSLMAVSGTDLITKLSVICLCSAFSMLRHDGLGFVLLSPLCKCFILLLHHLSAAFMAMAHLQKQDSCFHCIFKVKFELIILLRHWDVQEHISFSGKN